MIKLSTLQKSQPEVVKLMRPHQWVKNLFIFIAPFFGGTLFDVEIVLPLAMGFFAFSFAASSIYIFNDIKDKQSDQQHPTKQFRPIAAGKVKKTTAYFLIAILLMIAISLSMIIGKDFAIFVFAYLVINFLYSSGLKKISILDIFLVSSGFLLRTLAGGSIADVEVSKWLILMIFLLALFLAMAKKLEDLIIEQETGIISKKNQGVYNINFITSGITMLAGIIIVCYIMYSITDAHNDIISNDYVYLTSVFVIAGILRYLQINLVERKKWSPTRILFKDPFIILTIILWAFSFAIIIYVL